MLGVAKLFKIDQSRELAVSALLIGGLWTSERLATDKLMGPVNRLAEARPRLEVSKSKYGGLEADKIAPKALQPPTSEIDNLPSDEVVAKAAFKQVQVSMTHLSRSRDRVQHSHADTTVSDHILPMISILSLQRPHFSRLLSSRTEDKPPPLCCVFSIFLLSSQHGTLLCEHA